MRVISAAPSNSQPEERNLGILAGLSPWELFQRTARESWEDSVFGQGGRMAFYQFLAIFPSLVVFLAAAAYGEHGGGPMQNVLGNVFGQVLPVQVAGLLHTAMEETSRRGIAGWRLIVVCGGTA